MDIKSVYKKPKLKIHGNIKTITQGASGHGAESTTKRNNSGPPG